MVIARRNMMGGGVKKEEAMYKELWENYLSNNGILSFAGLMEDGKTIFASGSQRLTFRYGGYEEIDLGWANVSNIGNYTFESTVLKKLTIYKGVKNANILYRYGAMPNLRDFYILADKLSDYDLAWWNAFTSLNKACIIHLQDGEIYYDYENSTWAKRQFVN